MPERQERRRARAVAVRMGMLRAGGEARQEALQIYWARGGRLTAGEEAVFGEDGDGVDEENRHCRRLAEVAHGRGGHMP